MLGEAERCCHEVDFETRKYVKKIRLRLVLLPGPGWGSLQHSSRPPGWIWGSKGPMESAREGKGTEGEVK